MARQAANPGPFVTTIFEIFSDGATASARVSNGAKCDKCSRLARSGTTPP